MKHRSLAAFILSLLLLAGVQSSFAFRVVGYFPSWQGSVSGIQFSKVTHVNYAFLLPNSDGSLQAIDNASKLQQLVSAAHTAGVPVSISVGGWNNGDDSAFVSLAANSTYRNNFVNNLINFVNQYNLDGIDIDWEYPDSSTQNNYATLMSQLSTAMHSRSKLLTTAVIAYGSTGDSILSSVFNYVDWLNIMDYDNTSGVGQSTYSSAITAINYWVGTRGLPKSKAELGVPFYSDPSDYAFWDLLQRGANPNADVWGSEGYNGIPTIQNKTTYAITNGIGGMMIWELSEDATGTYSLLSAMYTVIQQHQGGSLPSGWTDADIGAAGVAGSASYSSGTFTVNGAGSDIWTAADQFNYAYESVSGNQTLIARVVSENGTQSYAKAGVMIRETLATNAVEVSTLLTPTNGVSMEVRPTTGAATINVSGWVKGPVPPQWVKLVRSGSTFTASYSANGSSWTQIASTNVTMATSATAGLAVTAHTTSGLNTAAFDNVSISASAPDFSLSASPGSLTITQGANGTSTITVNPVNGYTGTVSLSASGLPSGVTASFNPSSTTTSSTLTLTASSTAATGTATVTITGTDGTLTHTTTVSLTVNAAPQPNFSLSASPGSVTVTQGSAGSSTISVNPVNGYTGTVSLSASGLPSGVTASFNPASTTTSSTLTLTASSTATTGTATVTVTGTDGTLTHTTTVSLTVNASVSFSGVYQIQNEASGLFLNNQGSLTNGSAITQWSSSTSSNLDWTFIATSNGYYQINSRKSGLDAVVQSASTANGAGIIQWSFGSAGNDQWQPVQNSDGSYSFHNLHSGLVLEDPASSTNKTTQMDQWSANGGSNQKWKLISQ